MTIEIVSFPMNSMVIFHSYVTVYRRVSRMVPLILTGESVNSFFFSLAEARPHHDGRSSDSWDPYQGPIDRMKNGDFP